MDGFLAQNIVPKLEQVLSQFVINPADQKMDQWNCVIDWMDLINPNVIGQLVHRHFFPKVPLRETTTTKDDDDERRRR